MARVVVRPAAQGVGVAAARAGVVEDEPEAFFGGEVGVGVGLSENVGDGLSEDGEVVRGDEGADGVPGVDDVDEVPMVAEETEGRVFARGKGGECLGQVRPVGAAGESEEYFSVAVLVGVPGSGEEC
jgi:hypothetical protein